MAAAPPPPITYYSMIKEDHLKQTFLIATLVSAILGSFTTAMNLHDRVSEKRNQMKQKKTDKAQNDRIRQLEKRVDGTKGPPLRSGATSSTPSVTSATSRKDDQDLRDSLENGGAMVRREYDRDLKQLGNRFAEGDLIAQTQLQSQIITLQSTVISLLEGALLEGKRPDINKLYNASELARIGSIRALQDQYQRMLQRLPIQRPLPLVRRTSSDPSLSDRGSNRSYAPSRRLQLPPPPGQLFCRYAEDLQTLRTDRMLDPRTGCCPACGVVVPPSNRSCEIIKRVMLDGVPQLIEEREYVLSDRFIAKCHRSGPSGDFACYLCYNLRDADVICGSLDALAEHVCRSHSIDDYEADVDIKFMGGSPPSYR